MKKQVALYADTAGNMTADEAPTPGTIPMRDVDGNVNNVSETLNDLVVNEQVQLGSRASVTTSAALDDSAPIWPFDATSGAIVPTLPAVASCTGRVYIAKKTTSANTVTLTPNGSEKIDGASTYVMTTQWSTVWLYSDGTQWLILAKF